MNIFGRLKKQLSLLAVFSLVAQILFLGATPALALDSYTFTKTNYFIREANAADASGIRINVPNTTVATVFSVDGSLIPIPGLFMSNQGSYHVWKLSPTAFSEGEHIIEAAYTADNITWTPILNFAIVYSLDTAWFNYISPTTSRFVFRPSDNPGRIEIDDEFNQFNRVVFQVYNYNPITNSRGSNVGSYTVSRSACDVRGAGYRVICDINDSVTWSALPDGYYNLDITSYDIANGGIRVGHAGTDSPYFYVDSSKPTITNLTIDNINPSYPVLSKTVKSSVLVSDNIGIKDVDFYVTEPRAIDGACDGNGTSLTSAVSTTLNVNSRYEATINTSALNGNYCLNVIAEDMAGNHSSILKQQILLDNIAPVVNLDNPTTTHVRGTVEIVGTVIEAVSPSHYWFVIQGPANVDLPYDGTQPMTGSFTKVLGTWNTILYPDGVYTIKLEARDLANNKDSNSVKWRTVIVDNTAPSAPTIISPSSETYHKSTPIRNEWTTVIDDSGIKEYRVEYVYDDGHTFPNAPYRTATTNWRNHIPSSNEQGGVRFRVQAIDNVGNYGEWSEWVHYYYDSIAPVVTLVGSNLIYVEYGSTYSELGAIWEDNLDGNGNATVTGDTVNPLVLGDYIVRYNYTDTAGNAAVEVTRTVSVVDTTKPVITLNGDAIYTLTVGDTYTDLGAVTDDGSPVIITGSVDTATEGTYLIMYNSTDASGNDAVQVIRTINVIAAPIVQTAPFTVDTPAEVQGANTEDQTTELNDSEPEVKGSTDNDTEDDTNQWQKLFNYKVLGAKTWVWLLLVGFVLGGWWLLAFGKRRRNKK